MAKKKVVHIVEAFGGGVFSFLTDMINQMNGEFDFVIVFARRAETPKDFKKFFPADVKFIEANHLARSVNPLREIRATIEIRKIIKSETPDVVHLHSSKAGAIGRLACPRKLQGKYIKMLYNPHGFSFLMEDSSKLKRFVYRMIEKILAVRKCAVVAVSPGEYIEARKITKKAVEIDNGIDLEKLEKETKKLDKKTGKKRTICTVGRVSVQKNPKLFNEIAQELPEMDFVWIGDGDLREELSAPNIRRTGWLDREEVLKKIAVSDVFLMTSLWEGLPIALLEAMYLRKTCIVNDVVGNRDVVLDGKTGYVVRGKEDFVRRIKDLDEKKQEKMGEEAKKEIVRKYDIKSTAKKYKEEYENN